MGFVLCPLPGGYPGRLAAACAAQVGNLGVVEIKNQSPNRIPFQLARYAGRLG